MHNHRAPSGKSSPAWLLLGLVMVSIVLQLTNASLIKYASARLHAQPLWLGLLLLLVLTLSVGRFVVWGAMHKRFPVSLAYPATALFFPCLVTLAWAYGETVTTMQIIGAGLVTAGVLVLLVAPDKKQDTGDSGAMT